MKPTLPMVEIDRQVLRGQPRRRAAQPTPAIDHQVVRGQLPPQAIDALQRVVARVPSTAAQTIDRQVLQGMSGLGDNGDFGGEAGPAIDPSTGFPTMTLPDTSSINWGSILNTAVSGGLNILKMEATPQGYFQTGPGGTVYRGPAGSTGFPSIPAFGSGVGGGSLLLLGGLALVLVLVAGRR